MKARKIIDYLLTLVLSCCLGLITTDIWINHDDEWINYIPVILFCIIVQNLLRHTANMFDDENKKTTDENKS